MCSFPLRKDVGIFRSAVGNGFQLVESTPDILDALACASMAFYAEGNLIKMERRNKAWAVHGTPARLFS
jgi:hypothetical protein